MPMNRQYLKARRKAMLSDEKKAACFSDWNGICLTGFSFSAISLIGWLPGCILSAVLDVIGLYLCSRRKECGKRVALCGLLFAVIGGTIAFATGAWKNIAVNAATSAFAYLVLSAIMTLLVMLGLYGFYHIRKGGRHR